MSAYGRRDDASTLSLLAAALGRPRRHGPRPRQRGQSRDDLLDALTRHIQICAEITDSPAAPVLLRQGCRPRSATCRRPSAGHADAAAGRHPAAAALNRRLAARPRQRQIGSDAARRRRRWPCPGGGVATLGGGPGAPPHGTAAGSQRSRPRLRSARRLRPIGRRRAGATAAAADAPHRSAAGAELRHADAAGDPRGRPT